MLHRSTALVLLSFLVSVPALAQNPPAPVPNPQGTGVFVQTSEGTPNHMYPSQGALTFERFRLDFAPQSVGMENCANLPLNNTTDHPRVLTQLKSLDPKHFYISSPADVMLPLTLGGNSSLYINVCFKASAIEDYHSSILAIFQGGDTAVLMLTGKGVKAPVAVPIPKAPEIKLLHHKRNDWIFQLGMPRRGVIRLTLENMLGKTVRNFPFDDIKSPGMYEVTFDGKGDDGKKLAKGDYILRMEVVDLDSREKLHESTTVKIR